MTPLVFALGYAGFALLALAMPRHWRQVRSGTPLSGAFLRIAGGMLLVLGVLGCCVAWNVARGIPIALGVGTLAALGVALTLTWAPSRLAGIAAAMLVAGTIGAVIA